MDRTFIQKEPFPPYWNTHLHGLARTPTKLCNRDASNITIHVLNLALSTTGSQSAPGEPSHG